MVNTKKTKREKDIKSKLLAAVAMLLVSSIMMVSTTYAWFTLSTAPEVTGITTTIGSNGNLEIALSPEDGMGANVGDAGLNTTGVTTKNLTWGNLVDMSDASYGLSGLTLAPAMLAATGTAGSYKLGAQVLGTPDYGSDGRISGLTANAEFGSKTETGFAGLTGEGATYKYGVRAVGTSSGLSEQQAKFKTSVNNITNYANNAVTAASNSLSDNGSALASMLVQHAEAGDNDKNDYTTHVDALVALTSSLNECVANIDESLRSALIAAACAETDATKFAAAVTALEAAESVDAMIALVGTLPANFQTIVDNRDAIATKIANASAAANALKDKTKVEWADVSPILTNLMNTNGDSVKVSGSTITQIKEKFDAKDMDFLLGLATDCQIELGAGSGLYYDIATLTGNVAAKTTATVTSTTMQMTVTLKNVILKTTVASTADTPMLPVMKTAINHSVTPAGSTGGSAMDAFYGYVIDLMVRTNAADSHLLLQTVPAQRIYSDSANEATMGKGTTIVFTTTNQADVAPINNLIKSIRVVFFDPSHDNAIFGLAKVTAVVMTEEKTGTQTVQNDDGTTSEVDVITYTITGSLELCQMVPVEGQNGMFVAGDVIADSNTATADKNEAAVLCALSQNIPQAISAMVYLDGNNVTSSDVLAKGNVVGALNLQFASDADLKPMENSALRNGAGN